jgi:hypothetical protein
LVGPEEAAAEVEVVVVAAEVEVVEVGAEGSRSFRCRK